MYIMKMCLEDFLLFEYSELVSVSTIRPVFSSLLCSLCCSSFFLAGKSGSVDSFLYSPFIKSLVRYQQRPAKQYRLCSISLPADGLAPLLMQEQAGSNSRNS